MAQVLNLAGTTVASLFIEKGGVRLKNVSGNLVVRNNADAADAAITASVLNASGDSLVLNSDAAGAGADWTYTISRPASGMTAAVTITLPPDDGSPGQVLTTDGSGVTTWETPASTAQTTQTFTTPITFADAGSVVPLFTTPTDTMIERVDVINDTAFDAATSLSVGINGGSASKYMTTAQVDLQGTATTVWSAVNGQAIASAEDLEATVGASAAAAGAARIIVYYHVEN